MVILERLFPDRIVRGILDVNLDELWANGIFGLILDIDNTLARPGAPRPDGETVRWLMAARERGFLVCLLSNAGRRRVAAFSSGLGLPAIANAKKPGRHGFLKALRLLGLEAGQACMIGDQLFTDVCGAKNLGIFAIYAKPITLWEVFTVMLKRLPEALALKLYAHESDQKRRARADGGRGGAADR
ncbi:MAG: YqeG family HAD IIIA-type phosphatase [Clostridiales bacterium]|jgi:HAD superfamily phosphatase (TIGR01668 family)|nr:YqeG family HAD IIIA-type phosphatase [Clostridiales bacterium]